MKNTPNKKLKVVDNVGLRNRVTEFIRIGNEAVHEAQEANRKLGIPNVYGRNGKVYFELPDGTITTESPWKNLK